MLTKVPALGRGRKNFIRSANLCRIYNPNAVMNTLVYFSSGGRAAELKRGFKTSELSRLTGLTPRQPDHWDRTGDFKPSLANAAGKGSTRFYF